MHAFFPSSLWVMEKVIVLRQAYKMDKAFLPESPLSLAHTASALLFSPRVLACSVHFLRSALIRTKCFSFVLYSGVTR